MPALHGSKFNAKTAAIVIDAIGRGHSQRTAAQFAGVSHTAVQGWLKARPTFRAKVEQAQAQYLDKLAEAVTNAAPDDPRLALQILRAKSPEGWAERQQVEHTGDGGGPIRVELRWPDGTTPPSEMP